ncbi:MAG: hypothetical protein QG621_502 [Patescibacteria group bacterium]|nr:hypothetical protein [Patescibacteria group bacterium]
MSANMFAVAQSVQDATTVASCIKSGLSNMRGAYTGQDAPIADDLVSKLQETVDEWLRQKIHAATRPLHEPQRSAEEVPLQV